MLRLIQNRVKLSCCLGCSSYDYCVPAVHCLASTPLMDAFRQRKPIHGRAVTRSYTVTAKHLDSHEQVQPSTDNSRAALAVHATDAAAVPKVTRKRGRTAVIKESAATGANSDHTVTANPQPQRTATARKKPAAPKKKTRKPVQTASKTAANAPDLRTTHDIETAAHSGESSSTTAMPDIQPAPSGLPPAIPSGLPADPAVLHCWTKESMAEAAKYLAERDPALAPLIAQHGTPSSLLAKGFSNMFNSLALSILGQQLAVKAAKVITGRFMTLCQCEDKVTPEAVLAVTQEQLRAVGLSNAKARYVLDLASHFQSGQLSDAKIAVMDDETLVAELTKVKGIGQWTVDMFAMFHLGRPDIFPLGDLAVRKGLVHLYSLKAKPTVAEMDVIGDMWAPYRSLGSYYMWRLPIHQKVAKKKTASSSQAADVVPSVGVVPNIA